MNNISVKIGQLNLGRSKAATLEARRLMSDYQLDILLLQEPYSFRGRVCGLGGDIITISKGGNPMAAVVIACSAGRVMLLDHLSSEHLVCVEFSGVGFSFYLVSQYFQHADPIDTHLAKLADVLRGLPDCRVVVGADINARSTLWGPGPTNRRGEIAEEFIEMYSISVFNDPCSPSTFNRCIYDSHIDVTLGVGDLVGRILNWSVHLDASISDHNIITFDLCLSDQATRPAPLLLTIPSHFRAANHVCWEHFHALLSTRLDRLPVPADLYDHDAINSYANTLNKILIFSAERALGRRGDPTLHSSMPWWNPGLDQIRRRLRAARRAVRCARRLSADDQRIDILMNKYRNIAFIYKKEIKKSKMYSWRRFVESQGENDHWGPAYRAVTLANRGHRVLSGLNLGPDRGYAASVRENAAAFLDALVPQDNPSLDSPFHYLIRKLVDCPVLNENDPPPTKLELDKIINDLKLRKAPGPDRLDGRIIRRAWAIARTELQSLLTACFITGTFPDCWKPGLLTVIPKPKSNKPLSDPKAYRPITLLPVLGKVLERVIASRISSFLNINCPLSDRQFGFSSGRSTEDAIHAVLGVARNSNYKYVLAIFVDFLGAFDNAWWPMILAKLRLRGIPGNLYNLVRSYFSNRLVLIEAGSSILCREASIGCPQGSVLGPLLWNILMDDLLGISLPPFCNIFAYADDTTLVVESDSRDDLERKSDSALKALSDWGRTNRLAFSPHKTEAILLKGRLSSSRPPRFTFCGDVVRASPSTVYLGVRLDDRGSFCLHVSEALSRARAAFHRISRIAEHHWGIGFVTRLITYNGIFNAIVGYAASCWAHRCQITCIFRLLSSGQRLPLLNLCRGYRTTSTYSLQVIAGVLPLDLEVQLRAVGFWYRKGLSGVIGGTTVTPSTGQSLDDFKSICRELAIDKWQARWDSAITGRTTYLFFPVIRDRLSKSAWFFPSFHTSQFLSGHGDFLANLFRLGLASDPTCECGDGPQDVPHVLWDCPRMDAKRAELFSAIRRDLLVGPVGYADLISCCRNFRAFSNFAQAYVTRNSPSP